MGKCVVMENTCLEGYVHHYPVRFHYKADLSLHRLYLRSALSRPQPTSKGSAIKERFRQNLGNESSGMKYLTIYRTIPYTS